MRKMGIVVPLVFGLLLVLLASGSGVARPLKGNSLKPAQIEAEARRFVEEQIPWDPEMTEVTIDYKGKVLILPTGNLGIDFSLQGRKVRPGRFTLLTKISVDGVLQKKLRLGVTVERSIVLVKTSRRVRRGEILTEQDVELEVMKSNRRFRNAISSLDDVVGYEAAHSMGAGRVVTINALRKPPLVNKGDRVTLLVQRGPLKITAFGMVKEKGFKDSLVQVLNLQTKKTVYGQVVDQQTVMVNF
jgi:flagellar basal body P-ring formation protein FlgA